MIRLTEGFNSSKLLMRVSDISHTKPGFTFISGLFVRPGGIVETYENAEYKFCRWHGPTA
jgi:hypothetical protein